MTRPFDDPMTFTTVIDGRSYEWRIPVPGSLWADGTEEWRGEFLDHCRMRCAIDLQQAIGVELTERQTAGIAVALPGVRSGPVSQLFTVALHGGPLDGERVAVDPAEPELRIGIIAAGCSYPGGRSWYEPDGTGRWTWSRDTRWATD